MTTCKKPDRDVAALVCGYPMPCPHHTVVIAEDDLAAAVPTLAWVSKKPTVAICHVIDADDPSSITVLGVASVMGVSHRLKVWEGTRRLPFTAPMRELRDAFDELTREGHLALEQSKL